MNDQLKKKLRLNMLLTGSIFLTIAVIIFENVTKRPRFFSFIALALSFVMSGVVQIYNYKISKSKKHIFFAVIYFIIAIAQVIYLVTR